MSPRLTLLNVAELFYPDTSGGSGRVIHDVSSALARRGHEVHVLVKRAREDLPDQEIIDGIWVHRFGRPRLEPIVTGTLMSTVPCGNPFKQLVTAKHFCLVIYHHFLPAFACRFVRAGKAIPSVCVFHGPTHQEFLARGGSQRLTRLIGSRFIKPWVENLYVRFYQHIEQTTLSEVNHIITLSQFMRSAIQGTYRIPDTKVDVIPGGVNTACFNPAENRRETRRSLDLDQDAFIILSVRRLEPRMGLRNLIDAMPQVVARNRNIKLLIGGKGQISMELQARIEALGLENHVCLLGFIEDSQLPKYYQAADLFVLPSVALEGFGMVTLEALACGTPVLGTPTGATPEILERLDKRLLLAGVTPDSIAQGVVRFMETLHGDELRQRCARFAKDNYAWDTVAHQWEQALLHYAAQNGRPGSGGGSLLL